MIARITLRFILCKCNINLQYYILNPITKQTIVTACCTGGTTGFVISWFSVGATLASPAIILSTFLARSTIQQWINGREYKKIKTFFKRLSKDEDFQKEFADLVSKVQEQLANAGKIKSQNLNWNKNPDIRNMVQRLGVFNESPSAMGPLNLNALDPDLIDPDLRKILEELNIIQEMSKSEPIEMSMPTKAKTVYFRDFVEKIADNDNELDLDVIDAEIVQEPGRIRIEN